MKTLARFSLAIAIAITAPAFGAAAQVPGPIYPYWVFGLHPDGSCDKPFCDTGGTFTLDGILRAPPQRLGGADECDSRCALELVLNPESCVAPDSIVGFHQVTVGGVADRALVERILRSVAFPRVARWLARSGWLMRPKMQKVMGAELIGLGVPRCRG